MKKWLNRQTYFMKMLSMFLLIISVTIFVLTVFFYQRYTTALTENLYDEQEKKLEKTAQTISNLNSEIYQLYNTLLVDSKVIGFSALEEFRPEENYATYLIVKKFYNINPYVNSLYIYNDMAKDTITCGSHLFNLNYCWNYLKEEKKASIFPSPLTETEKTVLTFAYPIYANSFDELSGGIFISLDMEKLSEQILGADAQAGVIVNDEGTILLSGMEENFYTDSSAFNHLFSWSQSTNSNAGSNLKSFDGQRYLCTFYKDSDLSLTFITVTPFNEIAKPMKSQRNLSLMVAGGIFLVAILIQYLMTKRLYQPLEEITEKFRDSKYAGTANMDEFALIRHVYEQALDEIKELADENAFYQPHMKSDLLKGLILGNQNINEIKEQLLKNNWNIPFEGMFISCVFIESCDDHTIMAPVIQTKIGQYLREKLGSFFYVEYIPIGSDQVVFLINTIEDIPITFDELVQLLDDAKEELLAKIHITLTISLDGVTKNMEDLNRIYQHVVELKKHCFVLGYNQVIYPGRILDLIPVCITYPGKLADEILSCMLHGNREEFTSNILRFFSILRQYTYQPASLLYNRLYLDILSQMQKLYASDKDSRLSADILHIPGTLDEGIDILLSIFDQYQEKKKSAEQQKDNKHFEKIDESRRYIEDHFNDCNLSAGMVAEYLGYSTNYFSRIFKTITGFYINDYIRQIRIVKAQELLVKSTMTIAEIADATGFSNPNYFYSIFKKETGLTPSAYRNVG